MLVSPCYRPPRVFRCTQAQPSITLTPGPLARSASTHGLDAAAPPSPPAPGADSLVLSMPPDVWPHAADTEEGWVDVAAAAGAAAVTPGLANAQGLRAQRHEPVTVMRLAGTGTFGSGACVGGGATEPKSWAGTPLCSQTDACWTRVRAVFEGRWRNQPVAVKVLSFNGQMADLFSGAAGPGALAVGGAAGSSTGNKMARLAMSEVAVSASLAEHPNLVKTHLWQVRCAPLSPEHSVSLGSAPGGGGAGATQRPVVWDMRLILEWCDRGTLRDSLAATTTGAGAGGGTSCDRWATVLRTALDVARGMAALHEQGFVHTE